MRLHDMASLRRADTFERCVRAAGMKIRFSNLIKGLREVGDDVTVVTPCINPPRTFHGAKARASCDQRSSYARG